MPGSRLWRLSRLPAQVGQRPQQATARVDHAGTRSSSPEVTRASSDGRAPHSNQWPKKGRGVAVITTLSAVRMVGGGAAICEPGCCTHGQGVAAEVDGRGGDLACRRASLTGTRAVSALNDWPGTSHRDEVRGDGWKRGCGICRTSRYGGGALAERHPGCATAFTGRYLSGVG